MFFIQTSHTFPLSKVKPLEGLLRYRAYCLEETKRALRQERRRRKKSPLDATTLLESWGEIEGLEYLRCPKTGSLFLADLPSHELLKELLTKVSQYRQSAKTFHADIESSRLETVYGPKRGWIEDTARRQGFKKSVVLEVSSPPSEWTSFLKKSDVFQEVLVAEEMHLAQGQGLGSEIVDMAILMESLDRVDAPDVLLEEVSKSLKKEGLLFVTALVSSGFDMTVLGPRNVYLYPPDRVNCFSLEGLKKIIMDAGFRLVEVSTPGVLDVEIVKAHLRQNSSIELSPFEKQLLSGSSESQSAFQGFLQQSGLSSFARVVGVKND